MPVGGRIERLDAGELGEDQRLAVGVGDGGAVRGIGGGIGGGEHVGDEAGRRALDGLAAGDRAGVLGRAPETLGQRVEAEAALQFRDVADRELVERLDGRLGGPVGGDAVADLGERDHRRRIDLLEAQRGEAGAVLDLDEVGLDADFGVLRGLAEGGVVGEAAGGLGGQVDLAELHDGFGRDLLERGAAGDQVLDVRRVLGDLALRLLDRAVVGEAGAGLLRTAWSWRRGCR